MKPFLARLTAACLLTLASGCSNEVRQVSLSAVRDGGTYVVAGLENHRREAQTPLGMPPGAVVAPAPPAPPNAGRQAVFEFVRAADDSCIGADNMDLHFPPPGSRPRYVAFSLPPGEYVARNPLGGRTGEQVLAPSFTAAAGKASYIGTFTLEPDGGISIRSDLAGAARQLSVQLTPVRFGRRPPLRFRMCAP